MAGDSLIPRTPMTHEAAVSGQLAERYLLGELDPAEREAYEAHYFDCPACSAEVMAGGRFVEGARAAAASRAPLEAPAAAVPASARPPAPAPATGPADPWWRRWLAGPRLAYGSALVLLVAIGHQTLVVTPALRGRLAAWEEPAVVASPTLLRPQTRGDAPTIAAAPGSPALEVMFDLPPAAARGPYRAEVRRASAGEALFAFPVPAPAAGEPVRVRLPRAKLGAGAFVLVLLAGGDETRVEVERYAFAVEKSP